MTQRKRTNFTDSQKAEIFARDRATCSFSGVSLWIVDQGLTPDWDHDWADHLKPSARGGSSTLDNGACVSSTYNMKKRDNGSDNKCLFRAGHITRDYVRVFGLPDQALLEGLQRRAAIVPADWWFNRALGNSLVALDWRVREQRGAIRHARDDRYWIRAALKRHARWSRSRASGNYASRGLSTSPAAFGAELLLALENVETESQYLEWLETLWPSYSATSRLLHSFDGALGDAERRDVLDVAADRSEANPQVIDALEILVGRTREAA